jgi:hypothetical protein
MYAIRGASAISKSLERDKVTYTREESVTIVGIYADDAFEPGRLRLSISTKTTPPKVLAWVVIATRVPPPSPSLRLYSIRTIVDHSEVTNWAK